MKRRFFPALMFETYRPPTSRPTAAGASWPKATAMTVVSNAAGLLKWCNRRARRCFLAASAPFNLFLLLLFTALLVLFLPSHLFVSQLSSGPDQPADNNNTWSGPLSHAWARQLHEQLRRIELSLKENRRLLQNIRKSIQTTTTNGSSAGRHELAFHVDRRAPAPASACHSRIRPEMATGINMDQVYEQLPFDNPDGGVWKQGWSLELADQSQFAPPKPKLKVFVVPHSHNDPGWIKTFDVYFAKQTRSILNNAVEQMTRYQDLKFIWAETSYLSAWWETATVEQRQMLRELVDQHRFEIVTGGWVMNDEANAHYGSIVAQMVEGHEWLRDKLAVEPRHGWAIDPFGLSPSMAYLLKAMGFRAMVIQRVHYTIKKHLAAGRNLEFRWRQHWETIGTTDPDILCHLQPFYSYDVPHTCGPDPKICCQFDFKRLPPSKLKCPWKVNPKAITEENIQERAETLLDQYRKKSLLYKTNSVLVPLGDDFRFDDPKEWVNQFENYRKLMNYMNSRADLNVQMQFATLNDYFDSVLAEQPASQNFPTLTGDFFTYCDRDDHYWSGYYTSKPFYKRFERVLASHLRATEILFSFANILTENDTAQDPFEHLTKDLMYARQNLALFQHHDGITGTAKTNVVDDYARRMFRSFSILKQVAAASLAAIQNRPVPELDFMHSFPDVSTPPIKHRFHLGSVRQQQHHFVLYNSLGWALDSQLFCFDIDWPENEPMPEWCLTSADGRHVPPIQINHLWSAASPYEPVDRAREVCLQPDMAPFSMIRYRIGDCPIGHRHKESFVTLFNSHRDRMPLNYHLLSMASLPANNTIENEMIRLAFDSSLGLLKQWSYYDSERQAWTSIDVSLRLMTFGTRPGGKKFQKSGAYIFLPDKSDPVPLQWPGKPQIRLTAGHLESRYEWMINKPYPVHLRFTLQRGRPVVEFSAEFHLSTQHAANRELLIRFEIEGLQNGERFYTDLNGFQMIARKRYAKIPLQGNVYPMASMAWMEDDRHRFSVLTGQPLGVTSLRSGTLEVFLDRRLLQDDFRGLNQPVIDNRHTRESFRLMLEPLIPGSGTDPATPLVPSGQMFESQTLLNPVIGMAPKKQQQPDGSGEPALLLEPAQLRLIRNPLPCDWHLLNFRRSSSKPAEFGLWLHRFGLNCRGSSLGCVATSPFSLASLLPEATISRLQWHVQRTRISLTNNNEQSSISSSLNQTIQIEPMQIVTYKLTASCRSSRCDQSSLPTSGPVVIT